MKVATKPPRSLYIMKFFNEPSKASVETGTILLVDDSKLIRNMVKKTLAILKLPLLTPLNIKFHVISKLGVQNVVASQPHNHILR